MNTSKAGNKSGGEELRSLRKGYEAHISSFYANCSDFYKIDAVRAAILSFEYTGCYTPANKHRSVRKFAVPSVKSRQVAGSLAHWVELAIFVGFRVGCAISIDQIRKLIHFMITAPRAHQQMVAYKFPCHGCQVLKAFNPARPSICLEMGMVMPHSAKPSQESRITQLGGSRPGREPRASFWSLIVSGYLINSGTFKVRLIQTNRYQWYQSVTVLSSRRC